MHRIRSHLTYANVLVTVLAFIVLGGGSAMAAFVVSNNSQVGPNTIYGHNAPAGKNKNVVADSVTGADVKESTLAKVPNADKLDGLDSTKFVKGNARVTTIDATGPAGEGPYDTVLFDDRWASVYGRCKGTVNNGSIVVVNPNDSPTDVVSENTSRPADHYRLSAGSDAEITSWSTDPHANVLTLSIERDGQVATAVISSYAFHNPLLNEDECHYQGHVIVNGA
jgi:hypothetical protein